MPKYFRAQADTGWTKESIHDLIAGEVEDHNINNEDEAATRADLKMFPVSALTDADCQWFVDKEFAIDYEHEEDQVEERRGLAMQLYKRVSRRLTSKRK